MAKMLEALERAKQERLKKMQEGAPAVADDGQPDESAAPLAPPPLAAPPAAPPPPARPAGGWGRRLRQPAVTFMAGISEMVVGAHDHQSPITEQVRQIRTNLETVLAEYRARTIVISSPVSGDGKTLVAANLATVLADDPDHEILLIDADMRKGDQHRLFGVKASPGLSEYLRDLCPLEAATHATNLPNLKIIPAGHVPEKPTVLLSSDRMISLIGELQRTYRWVVFDTPPLLPVTDALVLGRDCVGLILVVRMGKTQWNLIERAQRVLAETRLPVLGCILNDFDSHTKENAYYYPYPGGKRAGAGNGFSS
jgi:capsular exopolysaccharide synthesis family protein